MRSLTTFCGVIALGLFNVGAAQTLTPEEQLGKSIFFDTNLSIYGNQSCADCHGAEAGWTGPIADINTGGTVYEGSIAGRFGNRKPPSSAYATPSPILHTDKKGDFTGGNFWDGRATGEKVGSPAADQAQGAVSQSIGTGCPRPRMYRSRGLLGQLPGELRAGLGSGPMRYRLASRCGDCLCNAKR